MTKQDNMAILSNHEFFNSLDNEILEFLAPSASMHALTMDEVLFRQSEYADKFYLVLSGRISVEIPAMYGPALEIQSLGEGQILGWSWFIAPYRWDFQAKAIMDSSLLEFDGKAILARCESDTEFGYQLLKRFTVLMSERLEAARQKMMDQFMPPGFA